MNAADLILVSGALVTFTAFLVAAINFGCFDAYLDDFNQDED